MYRDIEQESNETSMSASSVSHDRYNKDYYKVFDSIVSDYRFGKSVDTFRVDTVMVEKWKYRYKELVKCDTLIKHDTISQTHYTWLSDKQEKKGVLTWSDYDLYWLLAIVLGVVLCMWIVYRSDRVGGKWS